MQSSVSPSQKRCLLLFLHFSPSAWHIMREGGSTVRQVSYTVHGGCSVNYQLMKEKLLIHKMSPWWEPAELLWARTRRWVCVYALSVFKFHTLRDTLMNFVKSVANGNNTHGILFPAWPFETWVQKELDLESREQQKETTRRKMILRGCSCAEREDKD